MVLSLAGRSTYGITNSVDPYLPAQPCRGFLSRRNAPSPRSPASSSFSRRTRSFPLVECFWPSLPGELVPSTTPGTFCATPVSNENTLTPAQKFVRSLKGMAVLEAIALAKIYGSVPAVRDVTFRLEPCHVLAYFGPNCSGKSTTVTILTGLLQP